MIIGTATIRMSIPAARSLKDKRSVIKSLKERLHNRFNVSVAEVDYLDSRQIAELGVAVCSNSKRHAEEVLSEVVNATRYYGPATMVDFQTETFGA